MSGALEGLEGTMMESETGILEKAEVTTIIV
jgi:hypothetical protein